MLDQRVGRVEVGADLAAALGGFQMLLGKLARLIPSAVLAPANGEGVGKVAVRRGGVGIQFQHLVRGGAGALVRVVAVVAQLFSGVGKILLDLAIALRLPATPQEVAAPGEWNRQQKRDGERPSRVRAVQDRPMSVRGHLLLERRSSSRRGESFLAAWELARACSVGRARRGGGRSTPAGSYLRRLGQARLTRLCGRSGRSGSGTCLRWSHHRWRRT